MNKNQDLSDHMFEHYLPQSLGTMGSSRRETLWHLWCQDLVSETTTDLSHFPTWVLCQDLVDPINWMPHHLLE
jgi:hypothetical protein